MRKILFFKLILIGILITQIGIAQNCKQTLYGKIFDAQTQNPLAFAAIGILGTTKSATSDENGCFHLHQLCEGKQEITVNLVGYKAQTFSVLIPNEDFTILLESDTTILSEILIEGEKEALFNTQVISVLEGKNFVEQQGKSLGEALKAISGLNSIQTGQNISKPVIHGLHSNRILILNNGIRQEGQQWGSEHAPEIDMFVAKKIQVIKGASGVRYGSDAIGGVIIVSPNDLPTQPKTKGEFLSFGASNGRMGGFSGLLEGKHKNLAWRVQSTIKRSGNLKTPNYYLANSGLSELNFSTELLYQIKNTDLKLYFSQFDTKIAIFSGSHIGNLTDLENAIKRQIPAISAGFSYKIARPYQDVKHHLFKLSIAKPIAFGHFHTIYANQINRRQEFDAHKYNPAKLKVPELDFRLSTHTLESFVEHTPLRNNTLLGSFGLSLMTQGNIYYGRALIPNFRNFNAGFFWFERLAKQNFELEIGLRYDFRWLKTYQNIQNQVITNTFNFQNLSGTLGAILNLKRAWNVKTNLSTAWRPPSVNELFSDGVHHGAAAFEKGDKNLQSEKSYSLNVEISKNAGHWTLEASIFYNYIQDYIYLKPTFPAILTIRGAFPSFQYMQTNAIFRGSDIEARYEISEHLELQTKGSFLWVNQAKTDSFLVQIPPPINLQNSILFEWDNDRFFRKPYLKISHFFTAKQNRVPQNSDYMTPPSSYHLFELNFGVEFLSEKQPLSLQIGVSNLTNQTYRNYLNRFRYYADEIGRNFSVKLGWKF